MLESIITDYLKHNRRLVLPGLGAFLRKDGGEVVFAPFLNKDDGILSGLVSQNYGTSTTEADEIIFQYMDNIREGIVTKGAFLIYPLGSLKKDPNGLLYLDTADLKPADNPVIDKNTLPEEPVRPEIQTEAVQETAPEVPVQPESVYQPEPTPMPISAPKDVPVNEQPRFEEQKTLADTLAANMEAPKTLNDLIAEKNGHQEQDQTPVKPTPKAPAKPVQTPAKPAQPSAQPERRPAVSQPAQPAAPKTGNTRPATAQQPATAAAPQRRPNPATASKKRKGDIILVLAVIIAIGAIIAMIYAYAIVDLPLFDLK